MVILICNSMKSKNCIKNSTKAKNDDLSKPLLK